MSERNKTVKPIVTTVFRHLCSLACVALGVYFCIVQTNGFIGATMAFTAAILISPLFDMLLKAVHLKLEDSYRSLLVIIAVGVDITTATANLDFWLLINVAVILVFLLLFLVLANRKRNKVVEKAKPKTLEKMAEPKEEVKQIKKVSEKQPGLMKTMFSIEEDEEDEADDEVVEKQAEPDQSVIKPVSDMDAIHAKQVENMNVHQANKVETKVEKPVAKEVKNESLDKPSSMVNYAMDHDYQYTADESTMKNSFACILAGLKQDEKVLICFMGKNVGSRLNDYYGYAITTKRLVLGKLGTDGPIVQAIALTKIEKVSVTKGAIEGILQIHTTDGVLKIGMQNETCLKIEARIQRFIDEIARLKAKLAQEKSK